jgi:hypothetical protein
MLISKVPGIVKTTTSKTKPVRIIPRIEAPGRIRIIHIHMPRIMKTHAKTATTHHPRVVKKRVVAKSISILHAHSNAKSIKTIKT